jgi:glycosyltransferase involved in cell wall biosynthesis
MRISLVNAVCGRHLDSEERMLAKYWHIPRLAEAIRDLGHDVQIVQAFHNSGCLESRGIAVHTVRATRILQAGASTMIELTDVPALRRLLRDFRPDALHFFGLTLPRSMRATVRCAGDVQAVVTASFHGGSPRRNPIAAWRQRNLFRHLSALLFTAQVYADQWLGRGVVHPATSVVIAPEVASPFVGVDREAARKELSVGAGPVFAWSGRLHRLKDPLTALRGFSRICERWPTARLLMAFESDELRRDIEKAIEADPRLAAATTLLGRLPHQQMETLFSAADFFLQTSRREYGGNALVEAMSCGAVPLVTDLPSVEVLTRDIRCAQRFPVGDAAAMVQGVEAVMGHGLQAASAVVRADARRYLSYPGLAAVYVRTFESSIAASRKAASE